MGRLFRAALYFVAIPAALSAEPKWIHVPSADFEIFSSAGEGDTRRVLQQFERVRSFFDQQLAGGVNQRDEPVRVVVFGSKKEYEPYRPNEFAAAFYTQRAGRDYIVLGGVSDDVFPTAVHEYVHLVARHGGMNMPPWLNEGVAELFSTLKPVGDKILVGSIIPGRMYELSQQKWVPLATIVAATQDSPYYNEKNKAGSLYNEGWALTHMLELSPEYSRGFGQLLQLILKGTPSQAAIESVYNKPLDAIEKDLQAYLRRDSFNARVVPARLQDGPRTAIEPADAFDVKLSLLDLNDRREKEAESRQGFADLAKEYPKRPEPESALGYLAWRAGRQDEAVKAFAAAFELGGRNPQMLWDYGRLAGNSDSAGAIRALTALLAGQPDRMDVRLMVAQIQLSSRQPKETLATLAPVKSVKPADAPRFFQLIAFAELQNGDLAGARAIAVRWLENAKDPAEHERADRFINSLNGSNRTATLAPVPSPAPPSSDDDGPPRLTRPGTQATAVTETAPAAELPSISGAFTELDCSGPAPKVVLQTRDGKVAFLMDDPNSVQILGIATGTVDMNCGAQKSVPVSIQYEPASAAQGDVKGMVRAIRFEPAPGMLKTR